MRKTVLFVVALLLGLTAVLPTGVVQAKGYSQGEIVVANRASGTISVIDVRTEQEWAICRLPGARLIPLPDLERRIDELPRDRPLVVYCHSGMRSAMAAGLLHRHGLNAVSNLTGGIDAWAAQVDPQMPRY